MRDISTWKKDLKKTLSDYIDEQSLLSASKICDIELGLFLWHSLFPEEGCDGFWVLLSGYDFNIDVLNNMDENKKSMIGAARHYLRFYKSKQLWIDYLDKYSKLDARIRLFDIEKDSLKLKIKDTSICSDRKELYFKTLNTYPVHNKVNIKAAKPGKVTFTADKKITDVIIPSPWENKSFMRIEKFNFSNKSSNKPINISMDELLATAIWMDKELGGNSWEGRFERIGLLVNENSKLEESKTITLQGLYNMVGMVSSGKSTLMQVLAVWAARRGYHISLVVDSVVSIMNIVELMEKLHICAVPILGTNRDEHLKKYHMINEAENFEDIIKLEGLKWLSTICPLDGLKKDTSLNKPFIPGKEPCTRLNSEDGKATYLCPVYYECPRHRADILMKDAKIFVATLASLIYTWAPEGIYGAKMRMYEMIYRISDIIVFDEADKVQILLDSYFSPTQVLADGKGSSWLNKLGSSVETSFYGNGRIQLRENKAIQWKEAYKNVQSSVDRLYRILIDKKEIKNWAAREHFSAQWLIIKFSNELFDKDSEELKKIHEDLMGFKEDPMAENNEHILSEAWGNLNSNPFSKIGYQKIMNWCKEFAIEEDSLIISKLEFIVILSVLEENLKKLINEWEEAEEAFELDSEGLSFFKNYLNDFMPIIPESPTGNLFGFEFKEGQDQSPGRLQVFRFMGIGRWLMVNFPKLFVQEGFYGPHTILLSGTSWAPGSFSYHIQAAVSAVLKAPDWEVDAINESEFYFRPAYYENEPIVVSGSEGQKRINNLKREVDYITEEGNYIGFGDSSLLEYEMKLLENADKRLLMLTGNYIESDIVEEYINEKMKVQGKWRENLAYSLIRDSDEINSEDFTVIQRGKVNRFLYKNAKVLVAPLGAIERGYNVLNEYGVALLGSAFFLVRPMPVPNDMNSNTLYMNNWAIDRINDASWIEEINGEKTLKNVGESFRKAANARWRGHMSKALTRKGGTRSMEEDELMDLYWTRLVVIWQVIGRLVRGGQSARANFIDSPFAPNSARGTGKDDIKSSMLVGMHEILKPYFDNASDKPEIDKLLAQALYSPLYNAISNIKGVEYSGK